MTFLAYIRLARLAHSVRGYQAFLNELGRLRIDERPTPKEGWFKFWERIQRHITKWHS
jgi:hypothetical protein